MSEQAPDQNPEHLKDFAELEKSAEHMLPTGEKGQAEKHEQNPAEALTEARSEVKELNQSETQPNPIEKLQAAEEAAAEAPAPLTPTNDMKAANVYRALKHIRTKLPAPQRALSKVVHQPVVRAVSETAGKTISRPSGLLGGGLMAFLGSTGYLYLAKHLGFRYHYVVFLALFFGGFAVGLILEFVVYAATAKRRHAAD